MQASTRSIFTLLNNQLREVLLTISAGAIVILFGLLLVWREPSFFWHDDYQSYFLGGFRDIARAWESGELPLLSPYSWFGGALAAEYQYGIFSIFINLCLVLVWKLNLTLPLTAAALSIIHLGVLASGSFRLARQRKLTTALSMMVALVASLNGWIITWGATNWFPALSSFAWLPWAWWSLELSLNENRGIWRFLPAGMFIYLILTAGWPFSVLMMVLVSTWVGIKNCWKSHQLIKIWSVLAAWIFGIGLSTPALIMLIEYTSNSIRGETGLVLQQAWIVPGASLLGLVLPAFTVFWSVFGSWQPHASMELASGLVPVVVLLKVLFHRRKKFIRAVRWELGLLALILLLVLSPSIGNFRWSFRWLPLLHILLGLLAAEGISLLQTKNIKNNITNLHLPKKLKAHYSDNLGAWALLLVFIVWVRALLLDLDKTPRSFVLGVNLMLFSTIWLLVERVDALRASIKAWMPFTVVFLSLLATYTHLPTNLVVPVWNFQENMRNVKPLASDIRYLSIYGDTDLFQPVESNSEVGFGTLIRPGNSSMYSGLQLVNGYSPIMPASLARIFGLNLHGYLSQQQAKRILELETGSQGLLELMGVDGLVVARSFQSEIHQLAEKNWQEVASSAEGKVFHRVGSPSPRIRSVGLVKFVGSNSNVLDLLVNRSQKTVPLLLNDPIKAGKEFRFATTQVQPVKESRLQAIADVKSLSQNTESLIVFSKPWYPGYRATLNGKKVPVKVLNLILPAVELPPGAEGRLVLEYLPNSLIIGSIISIATITVTLLVIGSVTFKQNYKAN
jgi:hypothetical protein